VALAGTPRTRQLINGPLTANCGQSRAQLNFQIAAVRAQRAIIAGATEENPQGDAGADAADADGGEVVLYFRAYPARQPHPSRRASGMGCS
jgi:hypothetical protein